MLRPYSHSWLYLDSKYEDNSFYTQLQQMDSFTYIAPTEAPADAEKGGSGGSSYCVVARTTTVETPAEMEKGGSGGNAYCVVA
ncbi:hypothetical protein M413DRAFT_29188 [Hebeloma cylindrosporum]|uniref:Uncharacterized protein n=1 Tax=Hebeloma cylindrosporum TaxID=76867 RepID=A0A0C3C775_HEBCY|nr:hypothetical protein M413DRAFT_29188 [Hebeloma cylindrosporum h7]